jgi:nicotinamidase/pyrazinamidase
MDTCIVASTAPALLVVDVQKDFCPGGALAVPDGDRVIPALNRYAARAAAQGWPVYASRDWHPPVTSHFKEYGGEWPPHCVQHTAGAEFHDDLRLPSSAVVVTKGESPDRPGYSALEGTTPDGRTLIDDLRARGVDHLYVGGLATDYCVRQSVLDARAAGINVTVLEDAIAGVDVRSGDSARAVAEMQSAGATLGTLSTIEASAGEAPIAAAETVRASGPRRPE